MKLLNVIVSCYNCMQCGVGLVVEHDLAKVETGVRFSYAAQKVNEVNFLRAYANKLLYLLGESNRGREDLCFERSEKLSL